MKFIGLNLFSHFFMIVNAYYVLLFRLYRSLENYDVVRGIFGGKVGTKSITCAALQAEANTDYAEAVKLYNEVKFSFYQLVISMTIGCGCFTRLPRVFVAHSLVNLQVFIFLGQYGILLPYCRWSSV